MARANQASQMDELEQAMNDAHEAAVRLCRLLEPLEPMIIECTGKKICDMDLMEGVRIAKMIVAGRRQSFASTKRSSKQASSQE